MAQPGRVGPQARGRRRSLQGLRYPPGREKSSAYNEPHSRSTCVARFAITATNSCQLNELTARSTK